MTGENDLNDKLRAVFLAAIMVVSMAAIGATFAGSAYADDHVDTVDVDADELENQFVWQGQQLNVSFAATADNESPALRTYDDGSTSFVTQLDFNDTTNTAVVDTSNREGEYIIRTDAGDFGPFEVGVDTAFEAEFADEEVDFGGETTLSFASDRAGDQTLEISADGLDAEDLNETVFGAQASVLDEDEGVVYIEDVSRNDDIDANFDGIDAGDYEFEVSVADTTAEDTAEVTVLEEVDFEAEFSQNLYEEQLGDVMSITLDTEDLSEDDVLNVKFGENAPDEKELNFTLSLTDFDGDDITVELNTYLAGTMNDNVANFTSVDNASINASASTFDADVEGGPAEATIAPDTFRLELTDANEDRLDRAQAAVRDRSTDSVNTWTAPDDSLEDALDEDTNEERLEIVADLLADEVVTEADQIAEDDYLISEIEASGLEGALAYYEGVDDNTSIDEYSEAFNQTILGDRLGLEFEQQDVARNQPGQDFDFNDSVAVVASEDGDTYYVAVSLDDNVDYTVGGEYETSFSVIPDADEASATQWALVGPDEDGDFDAEVVTDEWESVELEAAFDTQEVEVDGEVYEDAIPVEAADGQLIEGDASAAPSTELTLTALGEVEIFTAETELDGDRNFAFELDLSAADDIEPGSVYELELDDPFDDVEAIAVVIDDVEEEEPADFQITDGPEDLEGWAGEEYEFDVTIENQGDMEDTQVVEHTFHGEDINEEELTLEGGEEETITFTQTIPDAGYHEGDGDTRSGEISTDNDTWEYDLTLTEDVEPAEFTVDNVVISPDTIEEGEGIDEITADVTNVGEETADTEVRLLDDAGDEVASVTTDELEQDDTESVLFDAVDAPAEEGQYTYTVETDDDSAQATLTVEAEEEPPEDDDEDDEPPEDDEDDDADDDGAGFGVIAAALALLGAALLAIRRQVQLE